MIDETMPTIPHGDVNELIIETEIYGAEIPARFAENFNQFFSYRPENNAFVGCHFP